MKSITVFTPTYNRAYCLHQVYDSLIVQTNQNFCWLIIDDGSSDNTKELVESWIALDNIDIRYIYQENQGMHGAHNTAYAHIDTELNVCIDSDDYMPADAIEIILNFWKLKGNDSVAGIVALDIDKKGDYIGTKMPDDIKKSTLGNLYHNLHVKGDKKLILRTEVVKKYPPYPIFKGERFVPLGTLYLMIDQDYELLCLNKPVCVVEYLEDGSSLNIYKQYKKNPKGFRYSRQVELKYMSNYKKLILKSLHLISSTFFIGDFKFFHKNPRKILTFFCLPAGFIFHLFINNKIKNESTSNH
ncbi:probable beta-glycosyltransferase [unidentified eubacterium SCB49]|nr:probable beta-glycosyltransferase [unidentified eubacterium SCB49]